MKTILLPLLILLGSLCADKEFLISDFDYTNQDFTLPETVKFLSSFDVDFLTLSDKTRIYSAAKYYGLNVVVLITRIQCESDIIECDTAITLTKFEERKSMAMGYGLAPQFRLKHAGETIHVFADFDYQVLRGARAKVRDFKRWRPGMEVTIQDTNETFAPKNAATFSLFRYTPFYGRHTKFKGILLAGNINFEKKFKTYKIKWSDLFEKG